MPLTIGFGMAIADVDTGDVPLFAFLEMPLTFRMSRTFNRPRLFALTRAV